MAASARFTFALRAVRTTMNPAFNDHPDPPKIHDDDAARNAFRVNQLEDPEKRRYYVAETATDVLWLASKRIIPYKTIARVMLRVARYAPLIWGNDASDVDEETLRTVYDLLATIGFNRYSTKWTPAQQKAIEILARE